MRGVAFLHSQGMVLRNIDADSVMVLLDGDKNLINVKLGDLSLAVAIGVSVCVNRLVLVV